MPFFRFLRRHCPSIGWIRLVQTALLGAIGCSLLGFGGSFNAYLELTSHFKVQYLGIGLAALIGFGWKRYWGWLALSLGCVLLNLSLILPWYFPAATATPSPTLPLRVLFANVQIDNPNYNKALSLIQAERPDLVVLVEVNQGWLDALAPLQPQFPYRLQSPQAAGFGIAIFSSLPLTLETVGILPATGPDARDVFLIARLDGIGDQTRPPITLVAMHPPPPRGSALASQRNQAFVEVQSALQARQTSTLLLGDLNTTMWSPVYQRFVRAARLLNSRQGFGILPTWPTHLPPLLIPIDHCLVSSDIAVQTMRTGSAIGSDHVPLIVDLRIAQPVSSSHSTLLLDRQQ